MSSFLSIEIDMVEILTAIRILISMGKDFLILFERFKRVLFM